MKCKKKRRFVYSSLTNLGNLGKFLKDAFISVNYSGYNDNKVM